MKMEINGKECDLPIKCGLLAFAYDNGMVRLNNRDIDWAFRELSTLRQERDALKKRVEELEKCLEKTLKRIQWAMNPYSESSAYHRLKNCTVDIQRVLKDGE